MEKYKGFYGTKEEYIQLCIADVEFWAKAIAEDFRPAFVYALESAEHELANEGFEWDEIEAIEFASY